MSYGSERHSMRNRSLETCCWPITLSGKSDMDIMFTAQYCSTNGSCSKKFKRDHRHRKLPVRLKLPSKVSSESGLTVCRNKTKKRINYEFFLWRNIHKNDRYGPSFQSSFSKKIWVVLHHWGYQLKEQFFCSIFKARTRQSSDIELQPPFGDISE